MDTQFRAISTGRLMPGSEQAFQEARLVWREALRGHVLAPPDSGFSARLSALAAAATQRAAACAAYKDGFEWPAARGGAKPPYELQPGTGRRGPEKLLERFDEAVAELDRVSEGRSIRSVGRAYSELAEVASELAAAVERVDRVNGLLPAEARKRRKSAQQHGSTLVLGDHVSLSFVPQCRVSGSESGLDTARRHREAGLQPLAQGRRSRH